MNPHRQVLLLIVIMGGIVLGVEMGAVAMLYHTALVQERARLAETARSQARLIEAVARFDARNSPAYPGGAGVATLSQIAEAHRNFQGSNQTGEFAIGRREGETIVFLLNHRRQGEGPQKTVPFGSTLAEPMRRALLGKSGTMIGLDYRGHQVLAAYEAVTELGLGIVAKIDLTEVRAPFVRTGLLSALLGLLAVLIGAVLFHRVTHPLVLSLERNVAELQAAMTQVKQLSGLLPICASCKKIRDDRGQWEPIETYLRKHSEASFTHGLCPACQRNFLQEMAPPET